MATNNSGTVNIAVYVTLDKEKDKSVLSFIVQDEYHLKKLAVGAYNLNILDTQHLKSIPFSTAILNTIACGDYVVCHNFTEHSHLNAILFNTKPTILKKGSSIFKIVYYNDSIENYNKITKSSSNNSVHDNDTTFETNKQLFKSVFGDHSYNSEELDENNIDNDNGDDNNDTDDNDENIVSAMDIDTKHNQYNNNSDDNDDDGDTVSIERSNNKLSSNAGDNSDNADAERNRQSGDVFDGQHPPSKRPKFS